ncbi:MAG: hypothetical protein LBQ54_04635 [Planctomycetaceae bacterium]|nr:hypothetical protein [Planctomycetaceae bacterium]
MFFLCFPYAVNALCPVFTYRKCARQRRAREACRYVLSQKLQDGGLPRRDDPVRSLTLNRFNEPPPQWETSTRMSVSQENLILRSE